MLRVITQEIWEQNTSIVTKVKQKEIDCRCIIKKYYDNIHKQSNYRLINTCKKNTYNLKKNDYFRSMSTALGTNVEDIWIVNTRCLALCHFSSRFWKVIEFFTTIPIVKDLHERDRQLDQVSWSWSLNQKKFRLKN